MRLFDMDSKEDYLLDGKYKVATLYAPLVDVVEVVRCKNCKMSEVFQNDSSGVMARYCNSFRLIRMVADDDYCSYGERKDDE